MVNGVEKTEQCMGIAQNGRPFCSLLHNCLSVNCCYERLSGYSYCSNHICEYFLKDMDNKAGEGGGKCQAERLAVSKYCTQHSCISCLDEILTGELDTDINPIMNHTNHFTCERHACGYIINITTGLQCNNMKLRPFHYCQDHCCSSCLQDGFPYDQPVLSQNKEGILVVGRYCMIHTCQVKDCDNKTFPLSGEYCYEHLCLLCLDELHEYSGVDPIAPLSQLCSNHRCHYSHDNDTICMNVIYDSSSPFCLDHTCRICSDLGISPPLGMTVEEYPRNVCPQHPLCIAIFRNGSLCHTITESLDTPYCRYHNNQNIEIELFIPPDDDTAAAAANNNDNNNNNNNNNDNNNNKIIPDNAVCHGITKKGLPCRNNQLNLFAYYGDKIYCVDHKKTSQ
jgi:hypothetical protein